ncbi:subgroup A Rous sarcoma virus receptor pg950 [Hyalella azteca]|uniref:Subgroup A Rous sarcoma virus receptor pg950 n=1 Tax=Hyalella azteca TaxID=294128 RepID=A0A8B7PCE1_HYAAZ|nr:subgroup A Rous sarcoma virus receptor pg950 [Hyalella azteca]
MKVICFILLFVLLVGVALGVPARTRRALTCKPGALACSDGSRCVPRQFVCDGVFDCGNGQDEENCSRRSNANVPDQRIDDERNVPTFGLEIGNVRNI